nr:sinapine esterase-like [Ipomoea batatas]
MSLPIVACALLLTALASSQFVDGCYTSIFAFGDSLSDTGNYISLTSNGLLQYDGIPSCSVPPYGETFFHHPTGRCSDGRVIIDFIAEQFGLPLVPPYSCGRKANRGGGGVNFAVVGAPALTEDVLQSNGNYSRDNISMMSQINMFKSLLQSICKTSSCDEIFDKSLIVFGPFGGDDYASAILSKRVEDALRLQPLVINAVASGIERASAAKAGRTRLASPRRKLRGGSWLLLRLLPFRDKREVSAMAVRDKLDGEKRYALEMGNGRWRLTDTGGSWLEDGERRNGS